MKKFVITLISVTVLSGCVEPVGNTSASFLNQADAPTYLNTQASGITSRKCLKPRTGGFGQLAPGCFVDTVFANQVAYPHDLTSPHTPGGTSPRTTAVASSEYLYGDAGSPTN